MAAGQQSLHRARFTRPCSRRPSSTEAGFCSAYKKTVDFVWKEFSTLCASLRGEAADQCTATAIIGYDKRAATTRRIAEVPEFRSQHMSASVRQGSAAQRGVQALQRGMRMASGSPSACTASCPGTSCPGSCVFPATPDPAATIYQLDGFLHFWPDYNGPYSINPYARFIHNKDGFAAPGAYSFSIDDFTGTSAPSRPPCSSRPAVMTRCPTRSLSIRSSSITPTPARDGIT